MRSSSSANSASTGASARRAQLVEQRRAARARRRAPARVSAPSRDERAQRLERRRAGRAPCAPRPARAPPAPSPRRGVFQTRQNATASAGLHHQPQVGEQVLHLAALVERHAAHDLVRHAALAQLGLERARLGVGAVQHRARRAARRRARTCSASSRAHAARLVDLVGREHEARAARRPRARTTASCPCARGCCAITALAAVRMFAGRAVVLLEPHHRGARERLLEVEHVREVGAAPAVDRLVVVADHEQVAVRRRQRLRPAGTARGSCPGTRRPARARSAARSARRSRGGRASSRTASAIRSSKSSAPFARSAAW